MEKTFSKYHVLADLMMDLQVALHSAGVWECERPSDLALQSVEPFCVDTMAFEQWLRFIMIERFKMMLETGEALPKRCHVAPMAEEAFKHLSHESVHQLVHCLNRIDQHLSGVQ